MHAVLQLIDHIHRVPGRILLGIHHALDHRIFHVCKTVRKLFHLNDLIKESINIPILTTFLESRVQVGTNNPFVEFCASDVFETVQRILVSVVFDEAEAARCLLESVKSHHEAFNLAASK